MDRVRGGARRLALMTALATAAPAGAQTLDPPAPPPVQPPRQELADAWWTGPMLANSPATLPPGRALVETYVYDVRSALGDGFGSVTYMMYGVADGLTIGARPGFGFNSVRGGRDGSGIGVGDLTLLAQRRLTAFDATRGVPAMAISLQASLPTGRYDRLGNRPADGLGSGAIGATLAFYAQHYFWLPNGRILRGRINLSGTLYRRARPRDVSVYGTSEGFRGTARPGPSWSLGGSLEYSVTRRLALALDGFWNGSGRTRVTGNGVRYAIGSSSAAALAPGIEYSWTSNLGVLLAARVVPKGRNTPPSLTPAIAINAVF